jgi:hypothetical protein
MFQLNQTAVLFTYVSNYTFFIIWYNSRKSHYPFYIQNQFPHQLLSDQMHPTPLIPHMEICHPDGHLAVV